ncbi:MAG: hypothetical protein DRJ40_09375 [Thermoprotei archaeon]|nr:MAG: hypothetical protein DRJ40_09375 [Thermoprotei archaeon]
MTLRVEKSVIYTVLLAFILITILVAESCYSVVPYKQAILSGPGYRIEFHSYFAMRNKVYLKKFIIRGYVELPKGVDEVNIIVIFDSNRDRMPDSGDDVKILKFVALRREAQGVKVRVFLYDCYIEKSVIRLDRQPYEAGTCALSTRGNRVNFIWTIELPVRNIDPEDITPSERGDRFFPLILRKEIGTPPVSLREIVPRELETVEQKPVLPPGIKKFTILPLPLTIAMLIVVLTGATVALALAVRSKTRKRVKAVTSPPTGIVVPTAKPVPLGQLGELSNLIQEIANLENKVREYESYLKKAREKYMGGELSHEMYSKLVEYYSREISSMTRELRRLEEKALALGAVKCSRCGALNLPQEKRCRRCGRKLK